MAKETQLIRIDKELYIKLKALAEEERRPLTVMVQIMYEEYMQANLAHQK